MHSSENALLNAFASPLPEYAPPVAAPEAAPDTTHDDTQLAASALAKLALACSGGAPTSSPYATRCRGASRAL